MYEIGVDDLVPLSIGATLLGTGGGGDPYVGRLMAQEAIRRHGPVQVVEPEEVPDDAVCIMSGSMGAPTIAVERPPGLHNQINAFRGLERHLGTAATHVLCMEIGGMNSTLPIVAAAGLGLPVVDSDAMGRAFPELQMTTPTIAGISAAPIALADAHGDVVIVEAANNHRAERLARAVTIEMGASAMIALFAQSGTQVRSTMIPGTLRRALLIGRTILESRSNKTDPVAALSAACGASTLFTGKITDVERRTEAGFARGSMIIDGTDGYAGDSLSVHFQNENLIAFLNGDIVASVPDLITVLDTETGTPITTEDLRYGFRVTVIGMECDDRWRTPEGLDLVGPRYFGYDVDYVPLEELNEARR